MTEPTGLTLSLAQAAELLETNVDNLTFQWPESGLVVAPDWKPNDDCGNGLHGLPLGVGDGGQLRITWWDGNRYRCAVVGDGGQLRITWWDGNRYRCAVAYVGENGIIPNQKYRLNDQHAFAEVEGA